MTTPVQEHLDRLTSAHAGEGEVPDGLGVAMLMVDGHRYVSGSMTPVPLATLASPLFHAQALEDLGAVRVGERVGAAPVRDLDHRVEVDAVTGLPHNPLQNAGAVATASLVKGRGGRDRTARMMQLLSALFDREVTVTESAARAENRAQHHTRSAAWLMKSLDTLDADPETLLEDIATVTAVSTPSPGTVC